MKIRTATIIIAAITLSAVIMPGRSLVAAEKESAISIPVGISYSSTYWWRGTELNGKGTGVIWPGIGLEIAGTGLSLSIAAGLNVDCIAADTETDRKAADDFNEIDYGLAWSTDLGDMVSLGVGVMYVSYPNADYGSFIEGSLSLGADMPFSPALDFYYDYYVEENGNDPDAPQAEDFYIKFSLGHDLISSGSFTCSAGAWIGYYNDPYFGAEGFSDAGISIGIAEEYMGVSFSSAVNYARSLSEDFQTAYGSGKLKNHIWADFGVAYSF